MLSIIEALLDGPYELSERPEPLPGDLRLAWGIAVLIVILGRSRAKRSSLQKLHFLAHAVRTQQTRDDALQVFDGTMRPADIVVRVEPWVDRAIAFSEGAGLVERDQGKSLLLRKPGIELFAEIIRNDDLLIHEKSFINSIAGRATEAAIDKVMRMERLL